MNKSVRNIMYVLITAICIIAIVVGVYAQFFKKKTSKEANKNASSENTTITEKTQAEIKTEFKNLFKNELHNKKYMIEGMQKIDESKEIVYSAIDGFSDQKEGKYALNVTIPLINIIDDTISGYNGLTQSIFVDKLNDIMLNGKVYTIFDIQYTAYINEDILSVAIMASLKEGENPQRVVVQTYNYNLKTKKEVTINDILTARALELDAINRRIANVVQKASEEARYMQSTGYNVYERNLQDQMYNVQNVNNFIQGPNGELYIIYAYGNNAYTSEMDIIEI